MGTTHVVALAGLVALAGCDQLFSVDHVDGPRSDARASDAAIDAAPDGNTSLLVQEAVSAAVSTTVAVTLETMPIKGHALILVGANTASILSGSGVSGAATTWTRATYQSGSQNIEVWYGVANGTSATVTMTASTSGEMWMLVSEWSGLVTTNLFENQDVASGSSSPATAGPLSPVDMPALLIFGVASRGAIATAAADTTGAPWTYIASVDAGQIEQAAFYQVATDLSAHTPATNVSGSWDAALAIFRVAP